MRKLIAVLLSFIMLFSLQSVVLAAGPSDISGTWKGLYVGTDNSTYITRNITLDLNCSLDGHVEGVATIETGSEFTARYKFSGTMDFDHNELSLKGYEMLETPYRGQFDFTQFDGVVDTKDFSYKGLCDNNSDRSFSLTKTNRAPVVESNNEEPKGNAMFDNFNIAAVKSNPTNYTEFTLEENTMITSITNYHYLNNGALPGQISLLDENGNIYGPWTATGRTGQGYVANAYWDVKTNITLKPGTYRIVDSDPSTWSHNNDSANKGFSVVRGYSLQSGSQEEVEPVILDDVIHTKDTKDNKLVRDVNDLITEPISVGVKFSWPKSTNGLGWRLYRSEVSGKEGISVTDFYITSSEFIDVNVDSNTIYYYVLREVLAEAKPFQGIEEKLGPASAQMMVKTPSVILGGNASDAIGEKQFILMTLDDPIMTVNGTNQEIDPGRGTTPVIVNNRTLAPIRAIVEAMGGEVSWDDGTRTVSIDYYGRKVKMTIDSKTMSINGKQEAIDVAPRTINSRTMLPVRFVSDALDVNIDWLNSTKQIVVVYINH